MEAYKMYRKGNIGIGYDVYLFIFALDTIGYVFHYLSTMTKKTNETPRLLVIVFAALAFGFCLGASFPTSPLTKLNFASSFFRDFAITGDNNKAITTQNTDTYQTVKHLSKIWVPSNPKGAERLPPGIVEAESDLYMRRLWGEPSQDLTVKPKYLVTFTVGYNQMDNVDAAVKEFSDNFTILLFHYDGRTTEWDKFEWSKRAIHISARKQTKWWYAKRFLHPDIVASYDYIFIWDEDLGVEHFNAEEYIKLARKYGLEISQPGLDPSRGTTWEITKRIAGREVHKEIKENISWCPGPHLPPCAAFVEIMAPVFSRDAWRCVWHMIQNDLVHGWGLDYALQKCVEPAHEKIGIVDAQWLVHQWVPSLASQGQEVNGKPAWKGVKERCRKEWNMFKDRIKVAENSYYESTKIDHSKVTGHYYIGRDGGI